MRTDNRYANDRPQYKHTAITEENYVDEAERVILSFCKDDANVKKASKDLVTTSKIRNILAMSADIYNLVTGSGGDELSEELNSRIEYLRVRIIYEAGREDKVKNFVETAGLVAELKNVGKSRKKFILFNRYLEALVAFHKYYGGKDN